METDMIVAERSPNRRLYKITLEALKIIPMLLAFCDVLNTFFSFYGIRCDVLSMFGGVSLLPLIFLYLVSYVFRFCIYHRMFLHYVLVTNIITTIDFYIGIPVSNEMMFGIFLFITGVFLFLVLYFYRREKCCRRLRNICLTS